MADRGARHSTYDAVVLGAGISGLVSASVLVERGACSVLVLDEYQQAGGNHLDFSIGPYTFDVGSLIFQDDSPLVHRFPELLPQYVPVEPSWSRLNPQGRIAEYPISVRDDLIAAGPLEWARMAGSLVGCRLRHRRQRNARDFARFWVGARLAHRTGLEHYIERFYGRPAEEIDLEFARARMMWIAQSAALRPRLAAFGSAAARRIAPRRASDDAAEATPNRQLVRPREGFAALYGPVVDRLRDTGVDFVLGCRPTAIEATGDVAMVRAEGVEVAARQVVSTIPVHRALELVGVNAEPLPTVTIISLLCSFAGDRGFSTSILYNFSHSGDWKRLTMHSDFYGTAEGREYFCVEVVASQSAPDVNSAESGFLTHVRKHGLFDGDLRIEGTHLLESVYPVYTHGSATRASEQIATLRSHGVQSLGKQGGFEYQPTARVSTRTAERALGGKVSPK
ncbi:NAD(P)-binding protein [Demequina sp. NBRC 110052]|uniref:NAD(P)-binding protein n=1 Tax=Demequina sp. NBRC 110052 TaxID=1570341 RepID=UPI000A00275A|nr:NAD(P)-binding protein [Demequina sp. NBRC 110052]